MQFVYTVFAVNIGLIVVKQSQFTSVIPFFYYNLQIVKLTATVTFLNSRIPLVKAYTEVGIVIINGNVEHILQRII